VRELVSVIVQSVTVNMSCTSDPFNVVHFIGTRDAIVQYSLKRKLLYHGHLQSAGWRYANLILHALPYCIPCPVDLKRKRKNKRQNPVIQAIGSTISKEKPRVEGW
jgi:hypothetical protein